MKIHFHFFVFLLILFMCFGNSQMQVTEETTICFSIVKGKYCPYTKEDKCFKACLSLHGAHSLIYGGCVPKGCQCTFYNPDKTKPCPPYDV
ncbi:uncharacterized protein DS421_8g240130 [Arachis hypogaea]|nr:uncharacterized protein DS421_8g240130 [Arachis hypogaea]